VAADRNSLKQYVREHLSLPRFLHSLRTAELSVELADRFGISREEAEIAALSHDMAREFPSQQIMNLAEEDALPILSEERQRPVLLHGRAAAVLLQNNWGETRTSVLQAVRRHTQGDSDMGAVGFIVYVADSIERGRSHISEEFRQGILHMDSMEQMVLSIAEDQIMYLSERDIPVSERTKGLVRSISGGLHAVVQIG